MLARIVAATTWRIAIVLISLTAVSACQGQAQDTSAPHHTIRTTKDGVQNGTIDTQRVISGLVRLTNATGCSGTMVAPDLLITAAHCVDQNAFDPPGHPFVMITGTVDVRFDNAAGLANSPAPMVSVQASPSTIFVHPNYAAGLNQAPYWDVALIKLPRHVGVKLAQPMRMAAKHPDKTPASADPDFLAFCQALTPEDPGACRWHGHFLSFGGYGNTSPGVGLPVGAQPRFGTGIVNYVGRPNYPGTPYNGSVAEGDLVHIADPSTGTLPLPGDSGGPDFVGPFPPFTTDVFWQGDSLTAVQTVVGVHYGMTVEPDDGRPAGGFFYARLSTPSTLAFLAPFRDRDGDGVEDYADRCVKAGASNVDTDDDGVGDACDNCPTANADQADQDFDGIGNVCDSCFVNDFTSPDGDGDGVPDACDQCDCDPDEVNPFTDVDGDGVCGIACSGPGDNCRFVSNSDQANCNGHAEKARGAEALGDACDPVPCPAFNPNLTISGGGSGSIKNVALTLNALDFVPLGSFDRAAVGAPAQVPATVPSTRYRYCVHDLSQSADCFDDTSVSDAYLSLAPNRAAENTSTLFHRVEFSDLLPDANDPSRIYSTALPYSKTWLWQDDFNYWRSTSWGGWIPDAPGALANAPAFFTFEGRFWANGNTPIGTTSTSLGTGAHFFAGTTTPASGLSNHYEPLIPFRKYQIILYAYINLPWIDRECPYCGPALNIVDECAQCGLDQFPEERPEVSRVVGAPLVGSPGVVSAAGGLQPLRFAPTPTLAATLQAGKVWVDQAEPSALFGQGATAPLAIALEPDGSRIAERAYAVGGKLLAERDFRTRTESMALGIEEASRQGFTAVYSRALGTVFLLGGVDGVGAPVTDLWVQRVETDASWQVVPTSGFELANVIAATYSAKDGMLWVLDEKPKIGNLIVTRRLVRVDPDTGRGTIVGAWVVPNLFDDHWLRIDRDGSLLVVASSSLLKKHAIARIGLSASSPQLAGVHWGQDSLIQGPIVDMAGYWLLTRHNPSQPFKTARLSALKLKPALWPSLANCL